MFLDNAATESRSQIPTVDAILAVAKDSSSLRVEANPDSCVEHGMPNQVRYCFTRFLLATIGPHSRLLTGW